MSAETRKPSRVYSTALVFAAVLFSITLVVVRINVREHSLMLPVAVILSAVFGLGFIVALVATIRDRHAVNKANKAAAAAASADYYRVKRI
jgi:hypothetical protein